ncbi:hypothetical protein B7R22_17940 [Subtercola boreus]|uniref:Uncharacterized protein n=2 Tax=Subtercola boreus TaxID=120213 RepID=A0A3E0VP13_9MICO|nr:hypothetical protein B7R22_17940 [Subtercola boreus]
MELTNDERKLLIQGLLQWGGPAYGFDSLAHLMGFESHYDLVYVDGRRIADAIEADEPMAADDWYRALTATEIVFSSYALGAASDWEIVTGFKDARSLELLRAVQHKVSKLPKPQALLDARLEARMQIARRRK